MHTCQKQWHKEIIAICWNDEQDRDQMVGRFDLVMYMGWLNKKVD